MMKLHLTLLVFSLSFSSLFAQWTADTDINTPVSDLVTGDLQSIGTSDGKTYVAFWHDVPAPKYYEMRLQLLDADGNPSFGADGMVVDSSVSMSSFTTIWSLALDADNNIYIGFNGTGANNAALVHKISPGGVQLWGDSGVLLGSGYDVKVLPLPDGSAIACWLPGNKGMMQKISAQGQTQWATPVTIEPAVASHKTSAGELAALSNGDFVVVLHDRNGFSPSALPFAQRYTKDGTAVWNSPIALSSNYYTAFNRRYTLVQDGDVLYFGYSGAQGIQPHGFVQRINPDGTLPWGINGADFSTQSTLFEGDVQIAFAKNSNVVWGICTYLNSSQDQVGEYVQKFDKNTGDRLLSNLGKEVFPVSAAYISHQGTLHLVNDQPVFLVSDGNSNGVFAKDLLAVYLDKNGLFVWPNKTMPIGTNATGVKSRIQFSQPNNGQVVASWSEARPSSGPSKAFAQALRVVPPSETSAPGLKMGLKLSPNPSQGTCWLEIDAAESSPISWRLMDLKGQILQEGVEQLSSGQQKIAIGELLTAGMYFVLVDNGKERKVLVLVVG